ncbi:MAG: GNAT family N-acetyltransferase [Flavobacteriaceae bacterium]|jgi:GNAT superfamily N-acetyltransferase|nr:GNAT family N-acetyltransferase [Flavobacteriaceae bacterium]
MDINFNEYKFSDDKKLISIDKVCELLGKSYWANNRSKEKIIKSIENSICIGIYNKEQMVGFSRIVTDNATMYWLCDVIIDENHQKKGLGKKLIEIITTMEELNELRGILATRDAHTLYEKYRFKRIPEVFMRREAE